MYIYIGIPYWLFPIACSLAAIPYWLLSVKEGRGGVLRHSTSMPPMAWPTVPKVLRCCMHSVVTPTLSLMP